MHTRKKSRRGGHIGPVHQHTVPVEWQLMLWLGIVVVAIGLVWLLSTFSEKIDGVTLTGLTGGSGANASAYYAASSLYWAAKSALARIAWWEYPSAIRPAHSVTPGPYSPSMAHGMSKSPEIAMAAYLCLGTRGASRVLTMGGGARSLHGSRISHGELCIRVNYCRARGRWLAIGKRRARNRYGAAQIQGAMRGLNCTITRMTALSATKHGSELEKVQH